MTIVLGLGLVCLAVVSFTALAVLCRTGSGPAILHRDLFQTLSLLVLMAVTAAGIGLFGHGFNQPYGTLHILAALAVVAGTGAAIWALRPWTRLNAAPVRPDPAKAAKVA
jgi:hypothetical protein